MGVTESDRAQGSALGRLLPYGDANLEGLNGLGHWETELVKISFLVSAQIMISRFVSLSTTSGSVLSVWSLLEILSLPLSLSLCPSAAHSLCLSLSKINK